MNKKEFEYKVNQRLKEIGATKRVKAKRHTFYISDETGNIKRFNVKQPDANVTYNSNDVDVILNACLETIADVLYTGDSIFFNGFGYFELCHWKPRVIKSIETGELITVGDRYSPRFVPGKSLRMAAKMHGIGQIEGQNKYGLFYDDEDDGSDAYDNDNEEYNEDDEEYYDDEPEEDEEEEDEEDEDEDGEEPDGE